MRGPGVHLSPCTEHWDCKYSPSGPFLCVFWATELGSSCLCNKYLTPKISSQLCERILTIVEPWTRERKTQWELPSLCSTDSPSHYRSQTNLQKRQLQTPEVDSPMSQRCVETWNCRSGLTFHQKLESPFIIYHFTD